MDDLFVPIELDGEVKVTDRLAAVLRTVEVRRKSLMRDKNQRCEICKERETMKHGSGKVKNLALDHCHASGKLRGYLCHRCNMGIGLFRDRPDLLRAAAKYLTR